MQAMSNNGIYWSSIWIEDIGSCSDRNQRWKFCARFIICYIYDVIYILYISILLWRETYFITLCLCKFLPTLVFVFISNGTTTSSTTTFTLIFSLKWMVGVMPMMCHMLIIDKKTVVTSEIRFASYLATDYLATDDLAMDTVCHIVEKLDGLSGHNFSADYWAKCLFTLHLCVKKYLLH